MWYYELSIGGFRFEPTLNNILLQSKGRNGLHLGLDPLADIDKITHNIQSSIKQAGLSDN